ncbi:nuclear transport factor 2 family protein [Pseudorhodoferax sp. Leaf265]|uniref:nuclear transport factor 2 family protein n=1 Tax=Pseudorhodoferax sp. Leaf265 TaxID=1736315 RepID=UPI0006FDD840|nr:nuclear transport factor 2 family protein [Pseudorhodoferax sp. Leaf265]KQP02138.1 ketosteroid isomerase [Pseudorhodoferax sp. Leaf265]
MSSTHKDLLARANAAVARGDHEAFLACCTEDTEWTFVGDRTLRGKQAVRAWMDDSYKAAPPRLRVHRMVAEGDFLTALGDIVLTDGSGRHTRHAYCDVWRVRDGRLAALHAFVVETDEDISALERP